MGILKISALWEYVNGDRCPKDKRLFIHPKPDDLSKPFSKVESMLEASLDFKLDNYFIIFERPNAPALDLFEERADLSIQRLQKRIFIQDDDKFWLHPNEFVLGATREYVVMPSHLLAHIHGRSSWGRTGLIIETAPIIHPGFAGTITLELSNVGTVPIALCPGIAVAQVLFTKLEDCEKAAPNLTLDRCEKLIQTRPEYTDAWKHDEVKQIIKRRKAAAQESLNTSLGRFADG